MPALSRLNLTALIRWLFIIASLIVGIVLYRQFVVAKPQSSIECDFVERTDSTTLRVPSGTWSISKLQVRGELEDTSQAGMLSFQGTVLNNGADILAPAVGDIFVDGDGAVVGLFLYVSGGQDQLRITTLNKKGMLDRDPSTAFLFFDPSQKLSHPVHYTCRIKRR